MVARSALHAAGYLCLVGVDGVDYDVAAADAERRRLERDLHSGANTKVVQQMLGQQSATMTFDLYGHLFPDQLDEVADRMDAAARLLVLPRPAHASVTPIRAAHRGIE